MSSSRFTSRGRVRARMGCGGGDEFLTGRRGRGGRGGAAEVLTRQGSPDSAFSSPPTGGATWPRESWPGRSDGAGSRSDELQQPVWAAISRLASGRVFSGFAGLRSDGVYRATDLVGETWGTSAALGLATRVLVGPPQRSGGMRTGPIAPSKSERALRRHCDPPNGGSSARGLLGLYRTDNAWAETPAWIQVPTEATGQGGYCGPDKCGYTMSSRSIQGTRIRCSPAVGNAAAACFQVYQLRICRRRGST
jgi:hypothetical protein